MRSQRRVRFIGAAALTVVVTLSGGCVTGPGDAGPVGPTTTFTSTTSTSTTTASTTTTTTMLPPAGGIATEISAGMYHSCAAMADGTVRCWGWNYSGELGDGTTTPSNVPVSVAGLTDVVAISAGAYQFSCALLGDGTVRCWGNNTFGQLGDGTTNNSLNPVAVTGLTGVTAISAGYARACAVLGDGTARCWGNDGGLGALGNGTGMDSSVPVEVAGLTGATAISAGGAGHVCARLADGTARCWGGGLYGQLGDGTSGNYSMNPVAVLGLSDIVSISAGALHTCAALSDGTARCWGYAGYGQLGNGTNGQPDGPGTPTAVVGLTNVVGISVSDYTSCAVLADGTGRCWGYGPVGDGSAGGASGSPVPVTVTGLTGAVSISVGLSHSCSLIGGGRARCWGAAVAIGDGTYNTIYLPVDVVGIP